MKRVNRILGIAYLLFFASAAPVWALTLSNFDSPESIAVDPADGSYYVSNVNGDLFLKDANGYVSKITPDGNLVIQRFIPSKADSVLNAPKGLWIEGRTIYVTDIDSVKAFDTETAKAVALVDLSGAGAKFLNDLTGDSHGNLYVSDTEADIIFKIEPSKNYKVSVVASGTRLGGPNGLLINPKSKNLMFVTWRTGSLIEIGRNGDLHVLKRGLSTLDGIDHDGRGNLYVSNFEKGEIYRIPYLGRGSITTFAAGIETPADIIYHKKRGEVAVPSLAAGKIFSIPDPAFQKITKDKPQKNKNWSSKNFR